MTIPFVIGQTAQISVRVSAEDVGSFAMVSGDDSPIHVNAEFALGHGFKGPLVHGAYLVALVSRLVGTVLPGSAAVLERIDLAFREPCYAPCTMTVRATVRQVSEAVGSIVLAIAVLSENGQLISSGKTWHKLLQTGTEP